MLGPNRKGAAPSMPALTTNTTTAVSWVSTPSARMVHSNIGARGSHQLEIPSGQGGANRLDVEAGGCLQDHGLPTQLAGELQQTAAEIATRSGERRVDDEERAAPLRATQARRVSGPINRRLGVSS